MSPGIAPRPPWLAYAALAASMALVGSYVGLSRLLVASFPVFLLAWLRFGIAALAMAPWLRRPPEEPRLEASDRWLLFWLSFLGNFLFSVGMLYGVKLTSALAAGVTMAALPAVVALLAWLFLRERIGLRNWAAIGCAAGGIATLAIVRAGGGPPGPGLALGYLCLVAAVCCEASYVVIGKRLTGRLSARRISAIINLWGLALTTPLGLLQAYTFDFASVASEVWALLVFYALAASMWSVWLWMQGLQRVPAPQAGVFTVLLPVSAALVGVLWLGEPFGLGHTLAFGLAILGLMLAVWPARVGFVRGRKSV